MTTYHVATDGSNANNGLTRGTAFRSPKAAVDVAASGSEVLLYYDAATDIEFTEGVELSLTNSLTFIGVDSADVRADDVLLSGAATTWNKNEQPTIIWTGSFTGYCIEPQANAHFTMHGVTLHGSESASQILTDIYTDHLNSRITVYDSTIKKPGSGSHYPLLLNASGSRVLRSLIEGGRWNFYGKSGMGISASFCIFSGSREEAVYWTTGGPAALKGWVLNSLFVHSNTDGNKNSPIFSDNVYLYNCSFYDNYSKYGIDKDVLTVSTFLNVTQSNPAIFHKSGTYKGTSGSSNHQLDPLFTGVDELDYRLGRSSPILELGWDSTAVIEPNKLTYDLYEVTGSWPIGPYMNPVLYYDPLSGSDSNSGRTAATALSSFSGAIKAASTDGGFYQTIYGIGNSIGSASVVTTGQLSCFADNLTLIGLDSNLNSAEDLESFNWDERPKVQFNHDQVGLRTYGGTQIIRGFEFDGVNYTADYFHLDLTVGTDIQMYDCLLTGFNFYGLYVYASGTFHRCRFTDFAGDGLRVGGSFDNASVTLESCIIDNVGQYVVDRFKTSGSVILKNCLFYKNGTSVYSWPIYSANINTTSSRCIFLDNYYDYGTDGPSSYRCTSYSSNTILYHPSGNYFGATNDDDYEINPALMDPDNDDFRLGSPTDLFGISSLSGGVDPVYTFDRQLLVDVVGPMLSYWSQLYKLGSASCDQFQTDFTLNTYSCAKNSYNKATDAIPFALSLPGPISLKNRKMPYRLTK
jgi:hypothetical protein